MCCDSDDTKVLSVEILADLRRKSVPPGKPTPEDLETVEVDTAEAER